MQKVKAWEKTYKELLKKIYWLRNVTGLSQFPLSQLMTQDNKCIFTRYPEEYLEFLGVCRCVHACIWAYVHVCVYPQVCVHM